MAVIGLGGVGSYALEALCRSGIRKFTIVDFDDICLTNINRQIHALSSTVGQPKVNAMAARLNDINPDIDIKVFREFYSSESSDLMLSEHYDYVLDAIDHFTSKIHLIKSCLERNLPIISSMGAAMKIDPTLVRVDDISQTKCCRMARSVRRLLKKEGIETGVTVVYSTEEFRKPQAKEAGCGVSCICPNRSDQRFSCEHRRVVLGSMMTVPAIFGMTMAGVVIQRLLSDS